jgi:hypothetical protein
MGAGVPGVGARAIVPDGGRLTGGAARSLAPAASSRAAVSGLKKGTGSRGLFIHNL